MHSLVLPQLQRVASGNEITQLFFVILLLHGDKHLLIEHAYASYDIIRYFLANLSMLTVSDNTG